MGRLFGTDGVRGVANEALTAELALDLSVAAAHVLGGVGERSPVTARSRWSAATRGPPGSSSRRPWWPDWPAPAWTSSGSGVVPTPGVAFLTGSTDADLGVMLSASHNPMPDNGIKFFARGGTKLDDAVEDAIEAAAGRALGPSDRCRAWAGSATTTALVESYVAHLVASLEPAGEPGRHHRGRRLRQRRCPPDRPGRLRGRRAPR